MGSRKRLGARGQDQKNGSSAAVSVVENIAELIVKYATAEKEVREVEKMDASTSQTQESQHNNNILNARTFYFSQCVLSSQDIALSRVVILNQC
jgi:uncharacterized protein YgiM (DUF1202 family)